ncbi:MAG: hypothetical protein F2832_08465 [Actinobacteria bacterium]|nr:hypothetical protein [Actinomycetota bacterium]
MPHAFMPSFGALRRKSLVPLALLAALALASPATAGAANVDAQISAGAYHTCALAPAGTVSCGGAMPTASSATVVRRSAGAPSPSRCRAFPA